MKKAHLMIMILMVIALAKSVSSQESQTTFSAAKATKKSYHALYVINTADEKHITGTLRNIKNALEDPRLTGKLQIELVAFGDGVAVYRKTGAFEQTLQDLKGRGVKLAQCENTIRERKIDKAELFDFIGYVPSGNGEIILRDAEGWAIVHP
ncbi:MAG: DsrE family protein [Mucilaginibacter polytrichastri]|nr:DsrE family protein [Mucilaginibacter polytrichastri]